MTKDSRLDYSETQYVIQLIRLLLKRLRCSFLALQTMTMRFQNKSEQSSTTNVLRKFSYHQLLETVSQRQM